ncbi:MAG: KOW domain-containing RNA-binding protein [Oscillospiraceae bacterium]|nr:KOW domain-containing RNA-binding protein [Oscillospiraceae bacterium]
MLELEIGRVVRSKAGRDKGRFLVIVRLDGEKVYVCDGKERPIGRPKPKNPKHLAVTETVVPGESLQTNRAVKASLHKLNYPHEHKAVVS